MRISYTYASGICQERVIEIPGLTPPSVNRYKVPVTLRTRNGPVKSYGGGTGVSGCGGDLCAGSNADADDAERAAEGCLPGGCADHAGSEGPPARRQWHEGAAGWAAEGRRHPIGCAGGRARPYLPLRRTPDTTAVDWRSM